MGRGEDLTGRHFGNWTVIAKAKSTDHSHWLCRCQCGREKAVYTTDLIRGKSKSCGCMRSRGDGGEGELIGKRFGKLLVLKQEGTGKNGGVKYVCQCDCGQIITTYASHLLGKKRSCGCNSANLIGQRFGKLTVVTQKGSGIQGKRWKCICDCGEECVATTGQLRAGRKTSCGSCRVVTKSVSETTMKTTDDEVINSYVIYDNTIKVTDRNGRTFICDLEDRDLIDAYTWYVDPQTGRPRTTINGKSVRFYRMKMNAKSGEVVDHINGDVTDNRRSNLRICNTLENNRNRHLKAKNGLPVGVHFRINCPQKPYVATIGIGNGKNLHKQFASLKDAIEQRKVWEKEYFGEFSSGKNKSMT